MARSYTATWPVQRAVDAALLAHSGLAARIGTRAYSGEASQGAALPYVGYGDASESERSVLGQAGASGVLTIHWWGRSAEEVHAMYADSHAALHEQVLPLPGAEHLSGSLSLATVLRDPHLIDREKQTPAYHAVGYYRWWALSAPGEV